MVDLSLFTGFGFHAYKRDLEVAFNSKYPLRNYGISLFDKISSDPAYTTGTIWVSRFEKTDNDADQFIVEGEVRCGHKIRQFRGVFKPREVTSIKEWRFDGSFI